MPSESPEEQPFSPESEESPVEEASPKSQRRSQRARRSRVDAPRPDLKIEVPPSSGEPSPLKGEERSPFTSSGDDEDAGEGDVSVNEEEPTPQPMSPLKLPSLRKSFAAMRESAFP